VKPLEGLIVLDITRFLAGPYCTLLLGGLGAEVIKIEPPGTGEPYRRRPPYAGARGASLTSQSEEDIGLLLLHRARNKKGITLNLRCPEGKELFQQLCAKADVVVENFAPGTLERIGIPFPVLQACNPRLILCSISGFGQQGPRRGWRAYDPIIQSMSGIASVTGYADRPPVRCGAAISDTTAPLFAVIGILSALRQRDKTGQGDWVDISMQDCSFFLLPDLLEFLAAGMEPERMGNRHIGTAPFNTYQATDGFVTICGITTRDWQNLLTAISREDLNDDPRFANTISRRQHSDAVDQVIQEWVGQRTMAEVVDHLQGHDVPSGPVLTPAQLLQDEHLIARDMVVDIPHPTFGPLPGVKGLGMPIKFTQHQLAFDQPAPLLGGQNEEIYGRLLGLDQIALQAFREKGII
jgi:crotonobetainyl-CoA:carnitine CoA-transferase CaiB-like acyl-CoA transferase